MSDPNREPEDPTSFRSIAVWWRALTCVPVGAIFGFVCALVILSLRGVHAIEPPLALPQSLYLAATVGTLWGAVYVPIAYLIFLRKERLLNALIGVAIGTILIGVFGLRFVGPFAPVTISASVGFWLSCIAIYANRERRQHDDGWQGYFSPPIQRK
ncbi:MAG TPA: hypothetical protein VKT51_02280 [Candidatus Eremiobacteraceae bacterium]|nr:hypothetical protein [Candidatus Eremiobacteraceae bacterium]